MRIIMVLLSVKECRNGRKVAENIENMTFNSLAEIISFILKESGGDLIKKHFGFFELSDFMNECNTEDLNLDNYWISYINLKSDEPVFR